jgi:hypothetical protein
MAINRYRLTQKVTLPSGSFTPDVTTAAVNYGTGSYAQGASEYGSGDGSVAGSTTWLKGMELMLDPTGALYTAIGGGNLVQITAVDDVGHSGLSN